MAAISPTSSGRRIRLRPAPSIAAGKRAHIPNRDASVLSFQSAFSSS